MSDNDRRKVSVYLPIEIQNDLMVVAQILTDLGDRSLKNRDGSFKRGLVIERMMEEQKAELKRAGKWDKVEEFLRREGVLLDEERPAAVPVRDSAKLADSETVRPKDRKAAKVREQSDAGEGVEAGDGLPFTDW